MLESRPPRRDPRILTLVVKQGVLEYAALDAFDLRLLGSAEFHIQDLPLVSLQIVRLMLQSRPTLLLLAGEQRVRTVALPLVKMLAERQGLSVKEVGRDLGRALRKACPPFSSLQKSFKELRALEPQTSLAALQIAVGALVALPRPTRTYAAASARST